MAEIRKKVKDFLLSDCLQGENPDHLKDDTPLMNSGILDSMSTLRLIYFLEDEFKIRVKPGEVEADQLGTLERIESFVLRKQS